MANRVFILKALSHQPLSRLQISGLINRTDHPFILLIGLPGSGKKTFINEILEDKPTLIKVSQISSEEDIASNLKNIGHNNAVCLVDDLEYDLANAAEKVATLQFLEKLLSQNPKKIIVSSAISPIKYLEHLEEDNESEIDRWSAVFGRFYLVYFPISNELTSINIDDSISKVIYEECRHGNFLQKLYHPVSAWAQDNRPKHTADLRHFKEEIVLEIQSMAEQYYKSLWRQCTDEEKYVLYDLAEDNLVNPQNIKTVNELIARGLVKNDRNVLEVMNQSFRNFIMTSIPVKEALELEYNAKSKGSWHHFRGPLILILMALSVFMFVTQQGALNTAISAITATMTLVAGLQDALGKLIPKSKQA